MIFLRFILVILGSIFNIFIIVAKFTNYGSFAFERSAAIIGEVNLIIFIIVIYLTTAILTCITAYLLKRSGPNWGIFSIVCPFLAPIILAFIPELSEDKEVVLTFIIKRLSIFTDRLSSLVLLPVLKITESDKGIWIIIGIIGTIILGVISFLFYGLMKVFLHRPDLRYIFLFLFFITIIILWGSKRQKKINKEKFAMSNDIFLNAIWNGNIETVRSELAKGADVDCVDYGTDGQPTALILSLMAGHEEIAKYLISKGTNVNGKDGNGNTCLFDLRMCKNGRAMAKLLIDNGADVNITNNFGFTALKFSSPEVTTILKNSGAR